MREKMQWIESTGGPLILLREDALERWSGYKKKLNGVLSDYERACQIPTYLGTLPVDGCTALIIGEEPLRTSAVMVRSIQMVVQWEYADSEDEIENLIPELPISASGHGISLELSGTYRLFDSSEPGDDLRDPSLTFVFSHGHYLADTVRFAPHPRLSLLLHRLIPVMNIENDPAR